MSMFVHLWCGQRCCATAISILFIMRAPCLAKRFCSRGKAPRGHTKAANYKDQTQKKPCRTVGINVAGVYCVHHADQEKCSGELRDSEVGRDGSRNWPRDSRIAEAKMQQCEQSRRESQFAGDFEKDLCGQLYSLDLAKSSESPECQRRRADAASAISIRNPAGRLENSGVRLRCDC